MTPQEIRDMLLSHDRDITTMKTYFRVIIGFGAITLPMIIFLVVKIASH